MRLLKAAGNKQHAVEILEHTHASHNVIIIEIMRIVVLNERIQMLTIVHVLAFFCASAYVSASVST